MMFSFTHLKLPEVANRLVGPAYERLKKNLVALMLGQRLETFDSESSNSGHWPPLADKTMRGRLKKVPKKKRGIAGAVRMLVDSGVLRQSFTSARGPGNAFLETKTSGVGEGGVNLDEVSIATRVEYAEIQNKGGVIHHPGTENGFGRKIRIAPHLITIPARPFDQFTPANEREIDEMVEHYVNG